MGGRERSKAPRPAAGHRCLWPRIPAEPIRSEPKLDANDWPLHCYVPHKSIVIVVYGKVAVARLHRDPVVELVLKLALHLPIDVGADTEATDIGLAR